MTDLAKLKEAAEKADPSLTRGASEAQVEKIIRAGMATVPYSGKADYAADAAYIVAACRAVPGLLTRLSAANAAHEAALARVAVLEGIIDALTLQTPGERVFHETWGPMEQDEQGGCVWCGHDARPNQKKRAADSHNPACPWTIARAALREGEGA